MNMLRKVMNAVTGHQAATELISIPSGRLFLVRPTASIKSKKECIFIDASCSIRRSSYEFQYEIVVTRTIADGEQALLEEDEETDSERSSLISDEIRFVVYDNPPEPGEPDVRTLSWEDISSDGGDRFEFAVLDATDEETIQLFEDIMYRCMWERKHKIDSSRAKESEIRMFQIPIQAVKSAAGTPAWEAPAPLFRPVSSDSESDTDDEDIAAQLASLSVSNAGIVPRQSIDSTVASDAKGNAPDIKGKSVSVPETQEEPVSQASSNAQDNGEGKLKPGEVPVNTAAEPPKDQQLPVWSQECQLFVYDQAVSTFVRQDEASQATLWVPRNPHDNWAWLTIVASKEKGGELWVSTAIGKEQSLTFQKDIEGLLFNFVYDHEEDGNVVPRTVSWCIRFNETTEFDLAQHAFTEVLFGQSAGRGKWAKLPEVDKQFYNDLYTEDIEMFEDEESRKIAAEEERLQEAAKAEVSSEEDEEEFSEEDSSDEEDAYFRSPKKKTTTAAAALAKKKNVPSGPTNSLLAIGYKNMLSFVVRGDMIGVFAKDSEKGKKLKFMTSIKSIATPDGKSFDPSKVMLHDQDSTMVLKNPNNPGALYKLDLTTGRVVEEWKVSDRIDIRSFVPTTKYAQTRPEQTFIGTSAKGIFRIDPRLNGSKLVNSQVKTYASDVDFSGAATTESGKLCVVSKTGEIRLYDSILGKNAKTALPSLGDSIISVDCTADGQYIVATCKNYLLFFSTKIGQGRHAGKSGFEQSFPADSKPKPMRLQLKPEHAAYMQGEVSFTPAKFNQGLDELENSIVTSTGPYVVAFNFRRAKLGKVDYTIKQYGENIVADAFRFGDDKDIVVAMPSDVFMERKSKLMKPTRESLAPNEGIVKNWS